MKKIAILTLAMVLVSPIFAERQSIKDRANNWLQKESASSSGLRGLPGIGEGEDPEGGDPILPGSVGGGLAVLLALGGGYMFSKKSKK